MELKVKFSENNNYPLKGFFIKSSSPKVWIKEIQTLGYELDEIEVYGLPNDTPNSVWGCLVTTKSTIKEDQKGRHELSQSVFSNFFVPEKSIVQPVILEADRQLFFSGKMTVFHPEIGFVTCEDVISFKDVLDLPIERKKSIMSPESSTFIPKEINSFEIKTREEEDVLQKLEEDTFPEKKEIKDEPLSFLEKAKLSFYKALFSGSNSRKDSSKESVDNNRTNSESKGWLNKVGNAISSAFGNNKMLDKMQQDFKDLDRRNQSELNKLMNLFKEDPYEALKYAIPLDDDNTSRGGQEGAFDLSKRTNDFSLFNNRRSSGGGVNVNFEDDAINTLRNQYNTTAQELIEKGEHKKAAFVYMKLLKNYYLAASTLADGGHYHEAATIYLKHTEEKQKAAECYEKGHMTSDAIEIYEELKEYEKVGDLYSLLNNREKAVPFYEKKVEELIVQQNYISASSIYENKIGDFNKSQDTLLDGWKEDSRERRNCLSKYLSKITDLKILKVEVDSIRNKTLKSNNTVDFLNIIQQEYQKDNEVSPHFKKIGYEIIAKESSETPSIVNELKGFNLNNSEIINDIQRFKVFKG